ncbi:MAG: hypothetical protein KAT16_00675 [Candidatus Heimdallarchaeota archaeon]|nr:hypothetical protein [Candidatus Heimdallarchaeota archaeon]
MALYEVYNMNLSILGSFFLQNETYALIDYIIIFLGPGAVLFFTFYLLWAGRRKNHKIIQTSRDVLLEIFSNEFEDLITDQLSSNGGLLFPKYKKSQNIPFKDFRAVFALEERHLMLSVIISWFSGKNDFIALEANPKKRKFSTKLQIIPKHEEGQIKKHKDLLFSLEDIHLNVEKLDEFFVIKSTSKRAGTYFIGDKALLKQIYGVRNSLIRISINPSENPSVRIYSRINKELDLVKLHNLFLLLFKRINVVAEKRVMK